MTKSGKLHPCNPKQCSNSARYQSQDICKSISQIILKNFIQIVLIIKGIQAVRIVFFCLYQKLPKISTVISIKHRILATFNIEKKFNSDSLYAFKECPEEILIKLAIVLKISKFSWNTAVKQISNDIKKGTDPNN